MFATAKVYIKRAQNRKKIEISAGGWLLFIALSLCKMSPSKLVMASCAVTFVGRLLSSLSFFCDPIRPANNREYSESRL